MTWNEILQLVIGSGGLIGIAIIFFRSGKLAQKVESMTTAMNKMETDLKSDIKVMREELKSDMVEMKKELKNEINSGISSVGGEILLLREDFKKMNSDVSDIKERVSFMEAFMFFSEFTAESNNPRSDSARKMWERRRAKKVEAKQL